MLEEVVADGLDRHADGVEGDVAEVGLGGLDELGLRVCISSVSEWNRGALRGLTCQIPSTIRGASNTSQSSYLLSSSLIMGNNFSGLLLGLQSIYARADVISRLPAIQERRNIAYVQLDMNILGLHQQRHDFGEAR